MTRCLKLAVLGETIFVEIHHFADASQHAYGVVSYLRMGNTADSIHCSFELGRSRLPQRLENDYDSKIGIVRGSIGSQAESNDTS